jgi:hypothetical protein
MIKIHRHKFKLKEADGMFKFCVCGKRKATHSVVKDRKRLQRKAEDLWRHCVHVRDGKVCMIKKVFPELNLNHSDIIQVDHFFPRADKNLFFVLSNATCLCATCNYLKSNGSPQSTQINLAVAEIVRRREGPEKFNAMAEMNDKREPNREWGRVHYLEGIIRGLEDFLKNVSEEDVRG